MRSGILCGGTCTVDRNKQIDQWPAEESVAEILAEARCGGGPALNVSLALRGLSDRLPIGVIGLLGDDEDGRYVRATMDDHDIDATQLNADDRASTSFTEVMAVVGTGRRTFFHRPGVSAHLDPDHVAPPATRARVFHVRDPGIHSPMDGLSGDHPSGHTGTDPTRGSTSPATRAGQRWCAGRRSGVGSWNGPARPRWMTVSRAVELHVCRTLAISALSTTVCSPARRVSAPPGRSPCGGEW